VQRQASTPQAVPISQSSIFSFTAPTEVVDIPSEGKFYPSGHPLRNKDSVEIKFMTAKEEDILVNKAYLRRGDVLDRLLKSVILDSSIEIDTLLLGDKNALVYATRIAGFGSSYVTEVRCPRCRETHSHEFNLAENLTLQHAEYEDKDVELTPEGTFIIKNLPHTHADVEVKLLNSGEEAARTRRIEQKEKKNLNYSFVKEYLTSFILSVNGEEDTAYIDSFLDNAPARDTRLLREIYEQLTPAAVLNHEYDCEGCGKISPLEVPLSAEFFWPQR
jgi:hypothetical protein